MSISASGRRLPLVRAITLAAALMAISLAGCAGTTGVGGTGDGSGGKIALLLPDAKTARYETFDRPMFENRIARARA